jgi:hypothetical protein
MRTSQAHAALIAGLPVTVIAFHRGTLGHRAYAHFETSPPAIEVVE